MRKFTLIELLVVIAIIAILAAMLLPALSSARARARSSDCLNRTKNLIMAANLYADDNNEFYFQLTPTINGSQKWWCATYDHPFTQYLDVKWVNSVNGTDISMSPLSPMNCPANESGRAGWKYADYGTNYHVPVHPTPSIWSKAYPRTKFANPTLVLMFACSNISGSDLSVPGLGSGTSWDGSSHEGKGIWFGHGKRSNISYSDGHCESVSKESINNDNFYVDK